MADFDTTLALKRIRVPKPQPGAHVYLTVPGDEAWEIVTFAVYFAASSGIVSTREFLFVLNDSDGHNFFRMSGAVRAFGGQTVLIRGQQQGFFSETNYICLPPRMVLPGNFQMGSYGDIREGDQFDILEAYVRTYAAV